MPPPNDPNKVGEWKEKLRQKNLGKKQSPETIEKRRKKLIGKVRTPEIRMKDSINKRGKKNFWFGKHHSLKHNQAIGEGVIRTWVKGGKKNNHPSYLPQNHPRRNRWVKKLKIGNSGKILSSVTKKRMSKSKIGHPTPQKTRNLIGKANRGHFVSTDQIKKQKKTLKKWFQSNEGQKWRKDQSKRRLSQTFPKKDSLPERILQRALKFAEISYETHKKIMGQPDIFIEPNVCIFVDGDYWHSTPKQKKRDKAVNKFLKKEGYRIIRLTEFDIEETPTFCIEQIINKIKK